MDKRKLAHLVSFKEKGENKKENVIITIALNGAVVPQGGKLDDDFIKVIQNEYAIKYLQQIGLMATQMNIECVLKQAPLSACEINAQWNNSGWLADSIIIEPNKQKKKTFENSKDELKEFEKQKKIREKIETDKANLVKQEKRVEAVKTEAIKAKEPSSESKFPDRITKDNKPTVNKKETSYLRHGITESSLKAANITPLGEF